MTCKYCGIRHPLDYPNCDPKDYDPNMGIVINNSTNYTITGNIIESTSAVRISFDEI